MYTVQLNWRIINSSIFDKKVKQGNTFLKTVLVCTNKWFSSSYFFLRHELVEKFLRSTGLSFYWLMLPLVKIEIFFSYKIILQNVVYFILKEHLNRSKVGFNSTNVEFVGHDVILWSPCNPIYWSPWILHNKDISSCARRIGLLFHFFKVINFLAQLITNGHTFYFIFS